MLGAGPGFPVSTGHDGETGLGDAGDDLGRIDAIEVQVDRLTPPLVGVHDLTAFVAGQADMEGEKQPPPGPDHAMHLPVGGRAILWLEMNDGVERDRSGEFVIRRRQREQRPDAELDVGIATSARLHHRRRDVYGCGGDAECGEVGRNVTGPTAKIGHPSGSAALLDPGHELGQAPQQRPVHRLPGELAAELVGITIGHAVIAVSHPVIHVVTVACDVRSTILPRIGCRRAECLRTVALVRTAPPREVTMPTTRVFARLAALLAATAGAVLTSFALASPAYAADVEVRIGNFPGSFTAGGQPRSFDASTTNKDKQPLGNVRHFIELRLDGLQPHQIKIAKGALGGQELQVEAAGDKVRAVDGESVDLASAGERGSVHRTRYWIAFMSDAPSGRADLTFGAVQGDGRILDTTSRDFAVKGGSGQNNPPTSAPATHVGPVPTFTAGPQYSIAPLQDSQNLTDQGSGIPVIFYVMGTVLMAAGGAILWLLFRPRPELAGAAYPAGDYETANPTLGYPSTSPTYPPSSRPANLRPTAVLPTIRDAPPPGVDPWSADPPSAPPTPPPPHRRS